MLVPGGGVGVGGGRSTKVAPTAATIRQRLQDMKSIVDAVPDYDEKTSVLWKLLETEMHKQLLPSIHDLHQLSSASHLHHPNNNINNNNNHGYLSFTFSLSLSLFLRFDNIYYYHHDDDDYRLYYFFLFIDHYHHYNHQYYIHGYVVILNHYCNRSVIVITAIISIIVVVLCFLIALLYNDMYDHCYCILLLFDRLDHTF